jgi:seryl-tRNA synthetase
MKKNADETKHSEENTAETENDMQNFTRLKEKVEELEKLCRKLQAEVESLQKSRRDQPVIRESAKVVTEETKQHEKRLQEIEKQVKNLNISTHKESMADTAFRLKFKRVIEKEFNVQEWGEQNVELRARSRVSGQVPLRYQDTRRGLWRWWTLY